MKRLGFFVGFGGVLLILSGCYTLDKTRDFSPYNPVGIVSVVSNYDINWIGEAPTVSSSVGDFLRKTVSGNIDETMVDISKADTLINDAELLIRENIAGSGLAVFMDKDTVLNAAAYLEAPESRRRDNETAKAAGYRFIDYRNRKAAARIAEETGTQALMFVNFTFTKEMVSGISKNGNFRANVLMNVTITDRTGKMIYYKNFNTYSRKKIHVSWGSYSHDELMDIFKSAIAEACYFFLEGFKR
ncbi:MAG: hypothetical protein LBQ88_00165 [Treponema sp.]|jgi:hypothetical protein|nr:hypothetical protein [Treponema sp.]